MKIQPLHAPGRLSSLAWTAIHLLGLAFGSARAEEPPAPYLKSIADRFESAWHEKAPLPALSRLAPEVSLDQAYEIQRAWVGATLEAATGRESGIGGVKGGVVTPGGQKALGITQPVGAILRASGRFEADCVPAVSRAQFPGLRLETEIGFVIDRRIEGPVTTIEAFRAHVRAIVPAIELVSGEWDAPEGNVTAVDLAGINVSAAGYIVGDPVPPDELDPRRIALRFSRSGETLHEASGDECWRGPWETALWLANFAHRQGIELGPGQVILCGALGEIQPGKPGAYRCDAGKLGTIRFTVTD